MCTASIGNKDCNSSEAGPPVKDWRDLVADSVLAANGLEATGRSDNEQGKAEDHA